MTTLLVIIWVLLVTSLILHHAVNPERSRLSPFELHRLDDTATLRRERLFATVVALRRLAELGIVVALSTVSLLIWQGWGLVITIAVIIAAGPLSRLGIIMRQAARIYLPLEAWLLDAIEKWPVLKWIAAAPHHVARDARLESPEQLLHLVEHSGPILSDEQRTVITRSLYWHTMPVSDVMVTQDIVSIKHNELLGPLVLDDLHKTGHSQFPVTKGSKGTVIGLLDITELLEVTAARTSQTAETAMSGRVVRIASDETLPQALALLQKSKLHMLIVIAGDGETVGLVTLADITGSLLGKTGVK